MLQICSQISASFGKSRLFQGSAQHCEHKMGKFGAFAAVCGSQWEHNGFWQQGLPGAASFGRLELRLHSVGHISSGLFLCMSHIWGFSLQQFSSGSKLCLSSDNVALESLMHAVIFNKRSHWPHPGSAHMISARGYSLYRNM